MVTVQCCRNAGKHCVSSSFQETDLRTLRERVSTAENDRARTGYPRRAFSRSGSSPMLYVTWHSRRSDSMSLNENISISTSSRIVEGGPCSISVTRWIVSWETEIRSFKKRSRGQDSKRGGLTVGSVLADVSGLMRKAYKEYERSGSRVRCRLVAVG